MSSYSGRRASNVSQYIANLNTVSSNRDMPQEQQSVAFEDDLAPFLHTEFFDWDMGQPADLSQPVAYDPSQDHRKQRAATKENNNFPNLDMFSDPSAFQNIPLDPALAAQTSNNTQGFPSQGRQNRGRPPQYGSPTSTTSSSPPPANSKLPVSLEEQSRVAAEEDKRRRNTAASARFRVKKKQREQALEKSEKEMRERSAQLEAKVAQLEMENKWLKELITEKAEGVGRDIVGDLLAAKLKEGKGSHKRKFVDENSSSSEEESTKKSKGDEERKDGVGTVKSEKARC